MSSENPLANSHYPPAVGWGYVARCWLIAVALLGLLLPGVGPLVDHHFVERHYHHGHLFLGQGGQRQVDHVHNYGLAHRHPAALPGGVAYPGGEDVVFLSSADAAGAGPVFLPGLSMNLDGVFDAGGGPLLLHFSAENLLPPEGLVGLPKKPPRG